MRTNNEFDIEREEDLFAIEKQATQQADGKKTKPHIIRRNVEDYLEKKALERRLKDIFDDDF
jgi:hypothetical protein